MLILVAALSSPAFALKNDYIKRLSRAHSVKEVQQIQTQFEELQITNKACRLQMGSGQAPLACYESLKQEILWGLHPRKAEQNRLRARLDELCAEAAEKLQVPRQISEQVSSRCRLKVKTALEILAYREHPPAWSEN